MLHWQAGRNRSLTRSCSTNTAKATVAERAKTSGSEKHLSGWPNVKNSAAVPFLGSLPTSASNHRTMVSEVRQKFSVNSLQVWHLTVHNPKPNPTARLVRERGSTLWINEGMCYQTQQVTARFWDGTHINESCQASKESEKIKGESPTVRGSTVSSGWHQGGTPRTRERERARVREHQ